LIYYKKIEKTMPRNCIIYRIVAAGLAARLAFDAPSRAHRFRIGQLSEVAEMNVDRVPVDSNCLRAGAKPIRIAVFHVGFMYSGGGERTAIYECILLKKRGYDVACFAPAVRPDVCYPELIEQIDLKGVNSKSTNETSPQRLSEASNTQSKLKSNLV